MRRIHALVAEYATNFVDALNTAHHGTLERQLGGDAHRHRLVKGIQVSAERTSRRAAVHQLQHRGFQLNIAVVFQHAAHSAGNQSALFHQVTRLRANHQVQVATAHPSFLVQILVQHGHGANRLRGHPPLTHHNRQFAAARDHHAAGHIHVIAQIHQGFPVGKRLFTNLIEREHRLNAVAIRTRLQGRKAEFTGIAHEHNTTRHMHHMVGFIPGGELAGL